MIVQINGESRDVPQQTSLEQVLSLLAIPKDRIAVELNQRIVRRNEWARVVLQEGDRLEIVHFVGGGQR